MLVIVCDSMSWKSGITLNFLYNKDFLVFFFLHAVKRGVTLIITIFFQRLRVTKEKSCDGSVDPGAQIRERIIKRAAVEFKNGMYGILRCQQRNTVCLYLSFLHFRNV